MTSSATSSPSNSGFEGRRGTPKSRGWALDPARRPIYPGWGRTPPGAGIRPRIGIRFDGGAMTREKLEATTWGATATAILAGLIVLGSRDLAHFDAALVGYTFATLFATFGIAYRYAMWLQRPPTALYWK